VELRRREESGEVGIGKREKGNCKGYLRVSPTMRNLLSLLYLRGGVISVVGTHFSLGSVQERKLQPPSILSYINLWSTNRITLSSLSFSKFISCKLISLFYCNHI